MKDQRRAYLILGIIGGSIVGCLSPTGAAATQISTEIKEAKALYYRAVAGDEKARKRSTHEFDRLANSNPDDAEVMAYRGSLKLLEAGKTWAVWRKYEMSKDGIALLDDAVDRAPGNLEVRFVRAATTRKLPAFFDRTQQSKDDLRLLADRISGAGRSA